MQLQREIDRVSAQRAQKLIQRQDPFGEYVMLAPSSIHYDDLYQRPISHEAVERIVKEFDPHLFGTLIIGLRGSANYVIDGQHRLAASLNLNLPEIPCIRFPTKNAQEEARLFVLLQERRRKLLPTHKFQAKLAYGNETALDIAELLRKYKFGIDQFASFGTHTQRDTLKAIGLIERLYRAGGRTRVNDVLHVLRKAWDGDGDALSKMCIGGLSRFMEEHDYDLRSLVDKLKEIEPFSLKQKAYRLAHSNSMSQFEAYAEAVAAVYEA